MGKMIKEHSKKCSFIVLMKATKRTVEKYFTHAVG